MISSQPLPLDNWISTLGIMNNPIKQRLFINQINTPQLCNYVNREDCPVNKKIRKKQILFDLELPCEVSRYLWEGYPGNKKISKTQVLFDHELLSEVSRYLMHTDLIQLYHTANTLPPF